MYEGKGLTVKELKEILDKCPDNRPNGDPTEVWIETGEMLSSIVTSVCKLNSRIDESGNWFWDILFESDAFES